MPTEVPLAIQFANSRYAVRGRPQEAIGTVEDLSAWLRDHVDMSNVNIRNVDSAVALRDAIRAVFGACVDGEPPRGEWLTVLNEAAAAAPCWPALGPAYELQARTAGNGLDAALAAIARDTIQLLAGPLRAELRSCRAPGCVRF